MDQVKVHKAINKNWIINGDFQVNQRGIFLLNTNNSSSDTAYYIDRFRNYSGSPRTSVWKDTDQPNELTNSKSLRLTSDSSVTDQLATWQRVEDYKTFNNKTFTISAYIKTNNANARIALWNNGGYSVISEPVVADGQWHKHTLTIQPEVTDSSFTINIVRLIDGSGNSVSILGGDYVEVTGVKVELGSIATEFVQKSYAEELQDCMRYYEKAAHSFVSSSPGTGNNYTQWYFKVRKRGFPTVVNTGQDALGLVHGNHKGIDGATIYMPTGDYAIWGDDSYADAEIY